MAKFIEKLVSSKDISNYICLTNASTDTSWCHLLMNDADSMCITRGRISFLNKHGEKTKGNSRGQIFFYKGKEMKKFEYEFSKYGKVIHLKSYTSSVVVEKGLFDE